MRFLITIFLFGPIISAAQVGGEQGYQLLELPTNARTAALAGSTVSLSDGDLSQFFQNPATLDSVQSSDIFLNINPYFADVFVFSGAYSFDVKEMGIFAVGLHYIDYNTLESTDASGNSLGDLQANDYVLSIGKSHKLGPMILGANVKLVHSSLGSYGSTAIAGDVGGLFTLNRNWSVGMVFSNLGGSISSSNELNTFSVPFDVKLGTTFKPEYMPLRFTLTTSNLVSSNVVESNSSQGRSNEQIERVLRRLNFGAELLLSDNFQILFGYNHKRKQELRLDEIGGGAGFSFGLMVRIKRLTLRYSRATFHTAGGSSFISIQTNLNNFRRIL